MRFGILTIGLTLASAVPAAHAQDRASVRTFLGDIYSHYAAGDGREPGRLLGRPERWFEPALARAMRRDAKESSRLNEVGALDGDPFCDCQDFERFTARIVSIEIARDRARAVLRFVNGRPVTLTYDLLWTRSGWRIRDIISPEGGLRRLFFKRG